MRRTSWVGLVLAMALAVVSTAAACDDEFAASPEGAAGDTTGPAEPTGTPEPTTEEPTVPSDDAQATPGQPRDPVPVPAPGGDRPIIGEVPSAYLEAVVADAAERARVAPERVEVRRAQAVQWNDGSLGCAKPGENYIQMIVDGYWVELAAGGGEFDYRLDGQGNFRLCDQPGRVPPYIIDR